MSEQGRRDPRDRFSTHPTGTKAAPSAEDLNVRHVEVLHYLRSLSPARLVAQLILFFLMALFHSRSPWLAPSRNASTR
jgi:hypothetical protein